MSRISVSLAALVFVSSAIASAAGLAPEIGVLGVKCWTKDYDLRDPYGGGLYVMQPVSAKVKLVLEYDYLTNSTKTIGAYHWGYGGDSLGSVMDELRQRNYVSAFQFGFRHTLSHTRTTFLEFGGGVCLFRIASHGHLRAMGADWSTQAVYKAGLVVDVSLLVKELINLPLVMRFGFKHRFLSESERTCWDCDGSTFHDAVTTTEISWGLGYQFGRRAAAEVGGNSFR